LDGIQNKIHPGDPADKDLYDLEPEKNTLLAGNRAFLTTLLHRVEYYVA
jgi:glutamine synthetase